MLKEDKLIEDLLLIPGAYSAVELLKGDLVLSTEDGIKKYGSEKTIWYKDNKNSNHRMSVSRDSRNSVDTIYYRGENNIDIIIRDSEPIEITFYDGERHGQVFVHADAIYYYNDESMTTASELLNGLSHVRSVEEYREVAVFPDDIKGFGEDFAYTLDADTGRGLLLYHGVSYVKELLSQKDKTARR